MQCVYKMLPLNVTGLCIATDSLQSLVIVVPSLYIIGHRAQDTKIHSERFHIGKIRIDVNFCAVGSIYSRISL